MEIDVGDSGLEEIGGGLSLFGVFDVTSLPPEVRESLTRFGDDADRFRQLFLFGHVGRAMWDSVGAAGTDSPDPIDAHSVRTVDSYFEAAFPGARRRTLYPGPSALLSLQTLGELAGVHHPSPFMVGIHARWGSWFAYRAVVVADTRHPTSAPAKTRSPCDTCAHHVCVSRCPSGALEGGSFDLDRCVTYRRRPDSLCRQTCLARTSCPVGEAHRYDEQQLRYHYGRSLQTIERYYAEREPPTR